MPTIEEIDDLLPQTQCGLCSYKGCRPYAEAIATQKQTINRCIPGGVATLKALAKKCGVDPTPFISDMEKNIYYPTVAIINEESCIGCTKCLNACPTDAILGASKHMHTIMADACTGCGLCLPPCPVDCIEIKPIAALAPSDQKKNAEYWRARFQAKNKRSELATEKEKINEQNNLIIAQDESLRTSSVDQEIIHAENIAQRRAEIKAAIARVQNKPKT